MRRSSAGLMGIVALVWSGIVTYGGIVSAEGPQCRRAVPANVELSDHLALVLQRMYESSETFRAQCDRIAAAPHVRVRVRLRLQPSGSSVCRARTVMLRAGRELQADVQIPPGVDLMELLAHEFEHILEQIDGVDVRRLARVSGSGVWEVDRQLFESARAQDAGRTVAREMRRHRRRAAD